MPRHCRKYCTTSPKSVLQTCFYHSRRSSHSSQIGSVLHVYPNLVLVETRACTRKRCIFYRIIAKKSSPKSLEIKAEISHSSGLFRTSESYGMVLSPLQGTSGVVCMVSKCDLDHCVVWWPHLKPSFCDIFYVAIASGDGIWQNPNIAENFFVFVTM